MYQLYALEPKSTVEMKLSEVRYIGIILKENKTIEQRLSEHKRESRTKINTHKCKWIRSLWDKGDDVSITLIKECNSIEELKKEEKLFISLVRNTLPDWKLTNGTNGGDGITGYKHSKETRKKLSNKTLQQIKDGKIYKRPLSDREKYKRSRKGFSCGRPRINFKEVSECDQKVIDQFGNLYSSIRDVSRVFGCSLSKLRRHLKMRKMFEFSGFMFIKFEPNY